MSRLGISAALCVALAAGCGKDGSQPSPHPAAEDGARPVAVAAPIDAAATPPRTRARPEKSKAYRAALRAGRKAGKARDYAGAIAAFERALEAAPGDPRALSELGWVAFKNGDLDRAADATEASIAAAVDPTLAAASLYNRGRIAEKRGQNQRAIEAYQRSLELRDHEIVKQRLAKLGGAVRKALAPVPLAGPYPSIEAACKTIPFFEAGWTCGAPQVKGPVTLEPTVAPYLEVRVLGENPDAGGPDESFDSCRLAIRTRRGWYLSKPVTCEAYAWARTAIASLRFVAPDSGGTPIVEWTVEHAMGDRGFDRDGRRYTTWVTHRWRFYCGIGASEAPSCTPVLPLSVSEEGDYTYSDVIEYELAAAMAKGAVLSVTSKGTSVDAAVRVFLGQRTLVFP